MLSSKILVPGIAVLAAGAFSQASGAAGPVIVPRPAGVMVDSPTTLTGTGFAPSSTLALRECGKRFWLDPSQPCNTANALKVTTNRSGGFKTTFHVELCPEGQPGKAPNQRVCFIGALRNGEDTGALEPAARVIVTYP